MGKGLTDFQYEDRILKSLRRRDGVATAGDVAADTGLNLDETERVMRQMLQRYQSHLDVDDEGNLLYRFDPKLKPRGYQRGRRWHRFKKASYKVFSLVFKIWIMTMLVGYTVAFVLLLIAFAVAGIAAATSSDSDAGGEMLMLPFYLIMRVLEVMFWISFFDSSSSMGSRSRGRGRGYGRGMMGRSMGRRRGGMMGRLKQRKKEKPDEPFYKKVFRYVFGPDESSDPLAAEKAFARFVRENQGRVTAADWASRTGTSLADAERALTASAVRFRGDIDVSDEGVLVYRFDELRVTAEADAEAGQAPAPIWERPAQVAPLAGKNTKKVNRRITWLNGFNLLMGAVILGSAVSLTSPLAIGLGWVPLIFSSIFFAIPGVRALARRRRKKQAAKENERRQLVEAIYLASDDGQARPVDAKIFDTSKAGEKLVVDFEADVDVSDDGDIYYTFERVAEQRAAGEKARQQATVELVFGQTIFSSDDEEMSLEDAEMAEFDERLARELEGQVALDFEMEWESVNQTVSA